MNHPPPYTITNESVTVVWEGQPHTVKKGSANFAALREACLKEDWDSVPKHLTVSFSLQSWAKGKFTVSGDLVFYDGSELPRELNSRILELAAAGEDPQPIFSFWERLNRNPSYRSVKQLWGFLQHKNIPLTEDGCFLAYKGVRSNYKDAHSNTFDNSPGAINEMPRNQISDDPNKACHEGFHVGALSYARSFSERVVVCKVDPEHVVCVPYDSNQEKMRVCRYEVVGNYGSALPSTIHKADIPEARVVPPKKDTKDKKEKKPEKSAMWTKFNHMDVDKLLEQSLSDLRKYATNHLLIVGGGRIPGGKTALVQRIIEVREGK